MESLSGSNPHNPLLHDRAQMIVTRAYTVIPLEPHPGVNLVFIIERVELAMTKSPLAAVYAMFCVQSLEQCAHLSNRHKMRGNGVSTAVLAELPTLHVNLLCCTAPANLWGLSHYFHLGADHDLARKSTIVAFEIRQDPHSDVADYLRAVKGAQ